jgi:sugar/nucleoside kinase (ribokinase family)/sugar phosphate isomerase/epimerase
MARSFVTASMMALLTLATVLPAALGTTELCTTSMNRPSIVVVGSLNIDIIVASRPPELHETVVAVEPHARFAMGGKGANQAVAAARLVAGARPVKFVGVFGNDAHAVELEAELRANGVDLSLSERAHDLPSGQGFVMLSPDGAASAVVIPGANIWWQTDESELADRMAAATRGAAVVMLQREIPDRVTLAAARAARAQGALVFLDAGGVDGPIPPDLLLAVDYVTPNESELARQTNMPVDTDELAFSAAEALVAGGAARVLATLGARGALLVSRTADGRGFQRARFPVAAIPGGKIVDATAAGDAFRAAVAVFLAEDRDEATVKTRAETNDGVLVSARVGRAAAAAGALAASVVGAAPSLPSRAAVAASLPPEDVAVWGLSVTASECAASGGARAVEDPDWCPLRFGSRLNSMRSRAELYGKREGDSLSTLEMVARLGSASGIDLVDFNYPQHLDGYSATDVRDALEGAGLGAGAVAIRFPADRFRGGAFTNPNPEVRSAAEDVVAEACAWATAIGATHGVVVWPQFDGYDYHFGVNHTSTWQRAVRSIQNAVDHPECRAHRVSFEFKPTDPSARFSTVANTHAALSLVREVARPKRFGLTLDIGHLLAAGENPAQSASAVLTRNALFGLHLGDAHSKLGAEDGLAFGTVHPTGALELVYTLRAANWNGHAYFDTFPEAEDPTREAEYNVRAFRRFWKRAGELERGGMGAFLETHDAMGSMELIESLED